MNYFDINIEEPENRKCINCDTEFLSKSKFNRICNTCKLKQENTDEEEIIN